MIAGLDFIAVDVETADSSYPESICQIGFAVVRDGEVSDSFATLVKPAVPFAFWQSVNLPIKETDLVNAPTFGEVARTISAYMVGPIFGHGSYDRLAITRACSLCGHMFDKAVWVDSTQVVRRAWPERYAKAGYGLANLASKFGIEFRHHDAGEDARVVAEVVIRASRETSLDIAGWIERVSRPISNSPDHRVAVRRDGNLDGPLYGEIVVLTGGFEVSKQEQADLAAFAGCEVASGVNKKTSIVVVGQDRFDRGERSGKWKRAEELVAQGHAIRIMSESDFRQVIAEQ